MTLTLYKLDASPPVRAVLMTLEVLGIKDVEMVDINIFEGEQLTEEFLKINPQHTIPTFKDDDLILGDSHAICTYLVNKYAENHPIYPTDPKTRALIDQRLHFNGGVLFSAARGAVEKIIGSDAKELNKEFLLKIEKGYQFLESFLTSTWLVGDQFTLADICCVATVSSTNVLLPIDPNLYPKLQAWLDRCAAKDFFKKCNKPGLEQLAINIKNKVAKNSQEK